MKTGRNYVDTSLLGGSDAALSAAAARLIRNRHNEGKRVQHGNGEVPSCQTDS